MYILVIGYLDTKIGYPNSIEIKYPDAKMVSEMGHS